MDIPKVYISFDGDHIGRKVGQASLSDDSTEIRRISQSIEKGNEIWRSWTIVCGGEVISLGGDEGRICVGADHLEDLPKLQERYAAQVDATVSVGVGLKLSEADKALMSSKLHGGNRITFYTPEIEQEIEKLGSEHKDEGDKLFDEYLDKSEGAEQHPLAGQFAQIIDEQDQAEAEKRQAEEQASSLGEMKSQVVSILQAVRGNAKELEALKDEAPHLYQSIQQLVQALITMGRQLNPQPAQAQPMAKAEGGPALPNKAKHFVMNYPIGFMLSPGPGTNGERHGGRVKVAHTNGKTSWVGVRSGMVMGPDGAPASSRNPNHVPGGE